MKSEEDGKDDDDISDLVTLDTVGFEDDSVGLQTVVKTDAQFGSCG